MSKKFEKQDPQETKRMSERENTLRHPFFMRKLENEYGEAYEND